MASPSRARHSGVSAAAAESVLSRRGWAEQRATPLLICGWGPRVYEEPAPCGRPADPLPHTCGDQWRDSPHHTARTPWIELRRPHFGAADTFEVELARRRPPQHRFDQPAAVAERAHQRGARQLLQTHNFAGTRSIYPRRTNLPRAGTNNRSHHEIRPDQTAYQKATRVAAKLGLALGSNLGIGRGQSSLVVLMRNSCAKKPHKVFTAMVRSRGTLESPRWPGWLVVGRHFSDRCRAGAG